GVVPEYAYLRNPTLTAEDNSFARAFEYSFCGNKRINYVPYLALFGVRNIVVRGDISPAFTDCVRRFDAQEVVKYLDSESRLQKVQSSKYLTNYEIRESSLLLPLFIPRTITSLQGTPDDLPILTSKKGYQLSDSFYLSSNPVKPSLQITANQPHVEYKKISPSKYRVAIHHAKAAFPLVLSTNFHPLWKIYAISPDSKKTTNGFVSHQIMNITQNDNLPSGHFYDILFQPIIANESTHQVINGYANSWRIEPYALCKRTMCSRNADGSYDIDFVIEFSLQKYFLIGWLLSALFSVIIAGRYAYSQLQKNKRA
ncbi:hypothetical protein HYS00_05445, partial [Candidatus Microgenomates bacterium]|nr:hypothetical protein [Candidatus Microgenomates bacterium]